MKQVIPNYKTGELQILEVPEPARKSGMFTVQTVASLVSVGTEKAMIDVVAKKSLLGKAIERPDWVKHVLRASYWFIFYWENMNISYFRWVSKV